MPAALQFDLIQSIVKHGIQFGPGQTVDPRACYALCSLICPGLPLAALHLDCSDQQPTLSILRVASWLICNDGS